MNGRRIGLVVGFVMLIGGMSACIPPTPTTSGTKPLNETGAAAEADYCAITFPLSVSTSVGTSGPLVYGQIYEAGTTEADGAGAGIEAQVGVGPAGSDPRTSKAWTYSAATYNVQVGNNDEYQASLPVQASVGSYSFVYRFTKDHFKSATYCDVDGAGSNPGLDFSVASLGTLTVTP